jgi:hypothetical protein
MASRLRTPEEVTSKTVVSSAIDEAAKPDSFVCHRRAAEEEGSSKRDAFGRDGRAAHDF